MKDSKKKKKTAKKLLDYYYYFMAAKWKTLNWHKNNEGLHMCDMCVCVH